MSDDNVCPRCPHPWGDHQVVAVVFMPRAGAGDQAKALDEAFPFGESDPDELPAGGYIICPVEPACSCYGTWSVPDEVAGFDVKARLQSMGVMPSRN